jgi:hypothetical protein
LGGTGIVTDCSGRSLALVTSVSGGEISRSIQTSRGTSLSGTDSTESTNIVGGKIIVGGTNGGD